MQFIAIKYKKESIMSSKQVTISARISHEDAEFLSRLEINGAKTPSDKLRAIISEAKIRNNRETDYSGSLAMIMDLVLPKIHEIRKKEVENNMHSEIITRMAEWIPDAMAFLISANLQTTNQEDQHLLEDLEQGLVDRLFRLLTSFLQLGVTDQSPCYRTDAIQRQITPILDLCDIISRRRQNKKGV